MQFMRIISHGPENAFFNMALDEAISESVRQKNSPPTLRLYQWERPSVSIGYFQKISDIDAAYCMKNDYPVVRRLTGGRAILHDMELTYSLSSLHDSYPFNGNLLDNYKTISSALLSGLRSIGIEADMSFVKKRNNGHRDPACFKAASYGEVMVESRKIIGSAQKRYKNGFMQHGSILFSFNSRELCSVLADNAGDNFEGIGAIRDFDAEISPDDFKETLKEAFEKELKIKLITDVPSKHELKLAGELQQAKYSSSEWNNKR
jgi:lipoate-protein ligase A